MRIHLASLMLAAAALPAQSFFVPDNDATTGNCNVFPFGSTGGANLKYQQLVTAAELNNAPGLITGIGFAQCGEGRHHFDTIEVRLAHKPGTGSLVATFAQNMVTDVTTVVSGSNYDWNLPASSWQDVGLQQAFAYNGVDNLVVEVTVTGSQWTATGALGSAGLRAGSHQRVYANNWTTQPPATGTLTGTFALKIEIDLGVAKVSSHGVGCAGSTGSAPRMAVLGLPQLGQTVTFALADGLPGSLGLRILGFTNASPYPVDLGLLGMPACLLYTELGDLAAALTDGAGAASQALTVPNDPTLTGVRLYGQWACFDPTANAFGWTTSNYVRAQIGT